MLLLFRNKKADDDLYSTLPDVISSSEANSFPDGVPGQRGRQRDEFSALWLNFQTEQRPVATSQSSTTKEDSTWLRKENQRLRKRLSAAEEKARLLEKICKQNQIDIPDQVTQHSKDAESVSSIATTVVVGTSSLQKINNVSMSNTDTKVVVRRSKSFSSINLPTSSPPSTPPRESDHMSEVRVRTLTDDYHPALHRNSKTRGHIKQTQISASNLDSIFEHEIDHEIPKISRVADVSAFDLYNDGEASSFRSCVRSFISPKNKIDRDRNLSISSYDDISRVHDRIVVAQVHCLKDTIHQGLPDFHRNVPSVRRTRIDRAEI